MLIGIVVCEEVGEVDAAAIVVDSGEMVALRPKARALRPLRYARVGLLWELLDLGGGEELRRGIEALPRGTDLWVEAGGV